MTSRNLPRKLYLRACVCVRSHALCFALCNLMDLLILAYVGDLGISLPGNLIQ